MVTSLAVLSLAASAPKACCGDRVTAEGSIRSALASRSVLPRVGNGQNTITVPVANQNRKKMQVTTPVHRWMVTDQRNASRLIRARLVGAMVFGS